MLVGKNMVLKGPYADHILIPQGSTGSSTFFDIKWKPIFFWLQIQNLSFKFFVVLEIWQKNVKLIGIPENNFLCIFILASSPGVHTFFCLWRVNKEATSGWNFTKCISEVKVNQLKVKNIHVKMGISTFKQGHLQTNGQSKFLQQYNLHILSGLLSTIWKKRMTELW